MTNRLKSVIFTLIPFLLITWLIWVFINSGPVKLPSGIIIPYSPTQKKSTLLEPLELPGYRVDVLADFEVNAKVLAVESYSLDEMSLFSPIDFALGWGIMSDQDIVDQLDIWQSGRWYKYQTDDSNLNMREIAVSSANMHLIPGSSSIEAALNKVRVGEIVLISGHLVRVQSEETNKTWMSSLKRTDTGGGACELFWVNEVTIVDII